MTNRVRFDLEQFAPFVFTIDNERFQFSDCATYAEIGNVAAGISSSVFKALDGRFFYVVVVSDEGESTNPYGFHHGWYIAETIDNDRAEKLRRSWEVLRDQPPLPGGPWR